MEIEPFQHPDSIWTWKSNSRGDRASLWIPYLNEVKKRKGHTWRFIYNGGELDVDLKKVDTIMLYGGNAMLPISFLDQLGVQRIPMLIHRRNMEAPTLVMPAPRADSNDILSRQIPLRANLIKATTIAKVLVRERFAALAPGFALSPHVWPRFNRLRQLEPIRQKEAEWSKRYWSVYFARLGCPEAVRREKSPVTSALDACSFFASGVLLRWILLHRMSPHHGFLHRPTTYPSLVYDLIEPYRYIVERAVEEAAERNGPHDTGLSKTALERIKVLMNETVYVPSTRQWVRRKNLFHGVVLALRAWMLGEMPRFVVPSEGLPKGGRPVKTSYRLPGGRGRSGPG
jgi:CRISPR/Cas system-associated endonuclease Cas1